MININAANGVTEFDLSVTDTATNPELWYLFRIVEKTSNNIVSPDAANSEVLKLKFTDAGLNITLTDKNTAVGSTVVVPGITKNNTYTLRLVNIENKIELQMKSNGVWESVYSGELTSAPYSSYMSFNWRGTAFKAAIDNLKFYNFGDTYKLASNVIPKLAGTKVNVVTASQAYGLNEAAFEIKDNSASNVAFTLGTSSNNTYPLILTVAPEDGKTYTVSLSETVTSLYGTPFRPESAAANVFNASDESTDAFCEISASESGKTVSVNAGVQNYGDAITEGVIIAALYDTAAENNITRLLDVEVIYVTAENPISANSEKALSFSLDAGEGFTGMATVKLLAWDDLNSLRPIIYPTQAEIEIK